MKIAKKLIFSAMLFPAFSQAETLACFGDSVTLGRGVAPQESFCARVGASLRARKIINAGVGGNNTRQARERFSSDVLSNRPTTTLVMFGLNDSFVEYGKAEPRIPLHEYVDNLRFFIRRLKSRGSRVLIMTSNVTANPWENDDLDPYAEAVRVLAREERVLFVDIHRITQRMAENGLNLWVDRVHPDAFTHSRIAERVVNKLRE